MEEFVEWVLAAIMIATASAATLWMAGAIFLDVCGGTRIGRIFTLAWLVGVLTMFVLWHPLWQPFVALSVVAVVFVAWWLTQKPRHDREWDPSVAVLPRATRDHDAITVENVRNFEYRSLTDFTPRYETRTYRLENLRGADIIFFNWGSPWMSHPVLVFDFGPDGRICISIEVRYRKGQTYSVLRSLYRQQELIFTVSDERDAILRRTKHCGQQAHLYHLQSDPEELRTVFLDYVGEINALFEKPRWYHGVCANCTTSFYRLPSSRRRLDWRVLANGHLDEALYEAGRLDRTLPFPELRRIAYLNDVANSAPEDGFGDHIRHELDSRHEC